MKYKNIKFLIPNQFNVSTVRATSVVLCVCDTLRATPRVTLRATSRVTLRATSRVNYVLHRALHYTLHYAACYTCVKHVYCVLTTCYHNYTNFLRKLKEGKFRKMSL